MTLDYKRTKLQIIILITKYQIKLWLNIKFEKIVEKIVKYSCYGYTFSRSLCTLNSVVREDRDLPDIKNIFRWQRTEIDFRFIRFTLFSEYPEKSIGLCYVAISAVSKRQG